jgi:hypothetical protein
MRAIFISMVMLLGMIRPYAQTMKWVPFPKGASIVKCNCTSSSTGEVQCYLLEYIPHVAGVLTSYTSAFFVSCTSNGSPIEKNESCSMVGKVNAMDGCAELGKVMLISAGNTGTSLNNKIASGQSVYLHQVCFEIPKGETITIEKAPNTNITCAVDLTFGKAITEVPAFVTQVIGNTKYDSVLSTEWLDFKVASGGDHQTQLDWSVSVKDGIDHFEVEHSSDGVNFNGVGEVKVEKSSKGFSVFRFTHGNAAVGKNFYRIQLVSIVGGNEYSPVRMITFNE